LKEPSTAKAAPKAEPKAAPKAAPKKETTGGGSGSTEPDVPYKSENYRGREDMYIQRTAAEPKARSAESSGSEKSVNERIKDSLASARKGSEGTDSRSVNERISDFAKENPKTATAIGVGSMLIPVGGKAVAAARAARAAYLAKKARDAGRSAEAATAARRAPRDVDESRFADEGNPNFKRGGIAKYAKGGGVESKGKTKGKIVKMAKGGSVRGYGVSKVTNKTKYC
jgi:hypothetical protein